MTDTKAWWQSRAIWSAIVAVLAGGASIWGYSVSAADQAQIVELVTGILAAIGGVGALVGRVMATHQITAGGK